MQRDEKYQQTEAWPYLLFSILSTQLFESQDNAGGMKLEVVQRWLHFRTL